MQYDLRNYANRVGHSKRGQAPGVRGPLSCRRCDGAVLPASVTNAMVWTELHPAALFADGDADSQARSHARLRRHRELRDDRELDPVSSGMESGCGDRKGWAVLASNRPLVSGRHPNREQDPASNPAPCAGIDERGHRRPYQHRKRSGVAAGEIALEALRGARYLMSAPWDGAACLGYRNEDRVWRLVWLETDQRRLARRRSGVRW